MKSMAVHRTVWSKVVKFGTLAEGHAKRPWLKFDDDWPKVVLYGNKVEIICFCT